jgi:ribonucleoside-diphosphate reductase alpha chain
MIGDSMQQQENNNIGKSMMSQSKFYTGYSRWIDNENRYETWDESVERVMNMHRKKYASIMSPQLEEYIQFAEKLYKKKKVVGSQRNLQFGGEQIFKHELKSYNCAWTYIDRVEAFQETMYALLCGVGVGFSVQFHHIEKLPKIKKRNLKKSKVHVIDDSIEGWAEAFGVLISSFMEGDVPFPQYQGCHVAFDFSEIRPKGSYISGGFKAPGPDGIRHSLNKCEDLLEKEVHQNKEHISIRPIVAYDYIMHMADAVLSGGVRRSATLCVFSKDDVEMMNAKIGNWFVNNPQRGRSNNSAILVRDEVTRDEFHTLMESTKAYGDPGFIFSSNTEQGFNPLKLAA